MKTLAHPIEQKTPAVLQRQPSITGKELEKKIRTRSAKVGVIGLGYVALSLAVEMAGRLLSRVFA